MNKSSIVFHRTTAGTEEIKKKSHGLTQSERLVLIMIDGMTTQVDLHAKLPVVPPERFNRALEKLKSLDLVTEAPRLTNPFEEGGLDKADIDRFLRQDPLDPLTLLLRDDGEEDDDWKFAPPAPPPRPLDRAHNVLAEEVEQEVRAQSALRSSKLEPIEVARKNVEEQEQERSRAEREARSRLSFRWYYLLLAIGLAFIGGFIFARFF